MFELDTTMPAFHRFDADVLPALRRERYEHCEQTRRAAAPSGESVVMRLAILAAIVTPLALAWRV